MKPMRSPWRCGLGLSALLCALATAVIVTSPDARQPRQQAVAFPLQAGDDDEEATFEFESDPEEVMGDYESRPGSDNSQPGFDFNDEPGNVGDVRPGGGGQERGFRFDDEQEGRDDGEGRSQARRDRRGRLLNPQPPRYVQETRISNPWENGTPLHFEISGREFSLPEGQTLKLRGNRRWSIVFHRGDSPNFVQYNLSEGTYNFRTSPEGWDLRKGRRQD